MFRNSPIAILFRLLSLLPFWALYLLSDGLYFVFFKILGYRKKVVMTNLKNAFPEKSVSERKRIAKHFFHFLPDLIVETIKMTRISAKEIEERIHIINPEEIERHFAMGRSIVGITSHYGNWEWGTHRMSLLIHPNPALIIYKPLSNQSADALMNANRSRFGAVMVPMKQTLRKIIQLQGQPHMSMLVADQTPTLQESTYFMEFLNQPTLVYTGPERIAKLTNSPVVYCHIERVKRGYYTCTFTTLVEEPQKTAPYEITHLHNHFTEAIIRQKPEWWLWSHRRWKRKPNN
jgi:KDO2-lipid IV(A) lauroyltransferase